MGNTPGEIDATKLESGLLALGEVVAIHELYILAITVRKGSYEWEVSTRSVNTLFNYYKQIDLGCWEVGALLSAHSVHNPEISVVPLQFFLATAPLHLKSVVLLVNGLKKSVM
ncbi:hypothetical protein DITRI_Ditri13aG0055000 [Diplodiscus trichospermus]